MSSEQIYEEFYKDHPEIAKDRLLGPRAGCTSNGSWPSVQPSSSYRCPDVLGFPNPWRLLKEQVISKYGGCCRCCLECELAFLSIDHVRRRRIP